MPKGHHPQACDAAAAPLLFVETICDDPRIVDANIRRNKLGLPDYAGMDADEAFRDFQARIAQYARTYDPVGDYEGSYVKLVDAGKKVIASRVEGYLSSRLVFFLMQIRPTDRPIWLTRHGESEFNVVGRIGGDARSRRAAKEYAELLASFVRASGRPRRRVDEHAAASDRDGRPARSRTAALARARRDRRRRVRGAHL